LISTPTFDVFDVLLPRNEILVTRLPALGFLLNYQYMQKIFTRQRAVSFFYIINLWQCPRKVDWS